MFQDYIAAVNEIGAFENSPGGDHLLIHNSWQRNVIIVQRISSWLESQDCLFFWTQHDSKTLNRVEKRELIPEDLDNVQNGVVAERHHEDDNPAELRVYG